MATKGDCSSTEDSSERKSIKILVLGDIGIGKTTLIQAYLGRFDESGKECGLFELFSIRKVCNKKKIIVELFDLLPGPNCPERRKGYPCDVNAILLCFSIGHYETLRSINNVWIYELRAHFGKNIPIFLVGLRSDVRLITPPPTVGDRVVEKSEAVNIHKNHRFYGDYMECSMKDRCSVITVFSKAILAALED